MPDSNWNEPLKKAAAATDSQGVAVFLNSPRERRASLVAWVGEKPREWVPLGITPLGECAADGAPRHREVRHTKAEKYHSYLYLGLTEGGEVLGVVVFSATVPDHFALAARQEIASTWAADFAHRIRESKPRP